MKARSRTVSVGLLIVAVAALALAPRGASAADNGITRFVFEGEVGDSIVGGRNVDVADSITSIQRRPTAPYEFFYAGGTQFYDVLFSAPDDGDRPRKGLYEAVQRADEDKPNGTPGLHFFGGGIGCFKVEGSYVIDQVSYDIDGVITAFAARFQQHCNINDASSFGTVAYNATVPVYGHRLNALSLTFPPIAAGARSDPQTITITNTSTVPLPVALVSVGGSSADQFQIVSNRCDAKSLPVGGTCAVDVVFAPTTDGAARARLNVADAFTSWGATGQEGEAIALNGAVDGSAPTVTIATTPPTTPTTPDAVTTLATPPAPNATSVPLNASDTTAAPIASSSTIAPGGSTSVVRGRTGASTVPSATTTLAEEATTIAPSTTRKSPHSRVPLLVLIALALTIGAAAIAFLRNRRRAAAPDAPQGRQADVPIPDAPSAIDATVDPALVSTIGEASRQAPRAREEPPIAPVDESTVDEPVADQLVPHLADDASMVGDPALDDDLTALETPSAVHVIDDDESLDELDLAAFAAAQDTDAVDDADASEHVNVAQGLVGTEVIAPGSMVCVLGPPVVLGRDALAERTIEIAVRLALEPGGVSINDLGGSLGHGGATEQQARSKTTTLVSRARGQLGDLDGEPLLPKIARGEPYRLHPRVLTDLSRLEQVLDRAATVSASEAIGALHAALALVRGRPFGEAPYAWAINDGWVGRAQDVVADAALRLAGLALDASDVAIARFAIDKGLLAAPDDEPLRELLRTIIDRETPT